MAAADISDEFNALRADVAQEARQRAGLSELFSHRLRRPLVIGIGLAMFQQITGINTVIYFAPTIFQTAGLSSAATAVLATAGVGAVNVIMTLVSIRLIDGLGRRALLFWSLGGMSATLILLSTFLAINSLRMEIFTQFSLTLIDRRADVTAGDCSASTFASIGGR